MNQKQENRAVIYIWVSTEDQADDALNLINHEKRCRNYYEQKGLTVVEAFIDAGGSARSSDRPEFQRMLSFCKDKRNKVRYVVVQDLSRFARNNRDQGDAIFQLVSQETFDPVQAILNGREPESPRLKSNPEFPLRRLVRCEACGMPLTSEFCKGRSCLFLRYRCLHKGCRAFKVILAL